MWAYPEIEFLGDIITYHARRRPDGMALACGAESLTWAQLDARANKVANGLRERLGPGEKRVGFLGRNSIPFFEVLFGVAKAGMTFAPLNWRLAQAEINAIVDLLQPDLMICDPQTRALGEGCRGAGTEFPVLCFGEDYDTLLSRADASRPDTNILCHDTAVQLYTSGTTGTPKGVELTHIGIAMMRLCEHFEPALKWTPDDVYLFVMPNFHLAGLSLVIQSLYNGSPVAMLPAFEPASVLNAIHHQRPSIMLMVPAMIQMLLDHPDSKTTDFSSLRLCMYAGSPIGINLIKRALVEMNCRFMQFYGATETGGAATLLRPDEHDLDSEIKLKSCGRPVPLLGIRIVDPAGCDLPAGQVGEVVIRSPALFKGYWRNDALTKQVKKDGWYWTGDAGFVDKDGMYYIVDRIKDMIVSGGENIYSAEVEQALNTHPSVKQCAVIGVPDPKWGETVKAFIVLKEDCSSFTDELIAHCRGLIAGFKVPRSIEFVDALPQSPTGKVLKRELRRAYWDGRDRAVG